MIRRPPRSTRVRSSAASDVYKRQEPPLPGWSLATPIRTGRLSLCQQGQWALQLVLRRYRRVDRNAFFLGGWRVCFCQSFANEHIAGGVWRMGNVILGGTHGLPPL